jgi:hypothetical protein
MPQITDLLLEEKPWVNFPPPRLEIFTGEKVNAAPLMLPPKLIKAPKKVSKTSYIARVERRRNVMRLMRKYSDSYEIAERMGLPRGTVWHDILYIRSHVEEFKNYARKPSNRIEG